MTVASVGHVAVDTVVTREGARTQLGGPPAYASLIVGLLGGRIDARSRVGGDFPEGYAEELRGRGVEVRDFTDQAAPTTRFTLDYTSPERRMSVTAVCSPLTPRDVEDLPEVAMLTPIVNELTPETLEATDAGLLALDPQGLVRRLGPGGEVEHAAWWDPALLGRLRVLKASAGEIERMTGEADPWRALARVQAAGVETCVATLGAGGALVLDSGRRLRVPSYAAARVADSTGAGDCFLAGLVYSLASGGDVGWACAVGSAAASLIVETVGPAVEASRSTLMERAEAIHEGVA